MLILTIIITVIVSYLIKNRLNVQKIKIYALSLKITISHGNYFIFYER